MKRILVALGGLVLVGALGAGAFWYLRERRLGAFAVAPFGSPEAKTVEIPPKSGPHGVAGVLARAGVVSSAEELYQLIRKEQAGPKLKAGEYEFAGALTPMQVLEKLERGEVKTYRFTVPEGLRADEILDILAGSTLKLNRAKLARLVESQAFLKKAGVPADRIEGFLYPDTYTFTKGADEEAVLSKMIARTLDEYRKADSDRKKGVTFDALQTLVAASIIEKETGQGSERPRISCVIQNRLQKHMRLGMDPTTLYAMMLIRGRYVNNLTAADLKTEHPYNTYTAFGLPPGPIANPGALAIEAALHPLDCNDLYYVSKNDGTHQFCPDVTCHEAAVEKWQRQFFREKRKAEKSGRKKSH